MKIQAWVQAHPFTTSFVTLTVIAEACIIFLGGTST